MQANFLTLQDVCFFSQFHLAWTSFWLHKLIFWWENHFVGDAGPSPELHVRTENHGYAHGRSKGLLLRARWWKDINLGAPLSRARWSPGCTWGLRHTAWGCSDTERCCRPNLKWITTTTTSINILNYRSALYHIAFAVCVEMSKCVQNVLLNTIF